jgi:glycosyltransferase involved in cell wall biosynthesis
VGVIGVSGKLRIQFITPGYVPFPTGGLRVMFEYADFLAARGHAVTVVFPRQLQLYEPAALGAVKSRLWRIETRLLNRPLIPWHVLHPRVQLLLVPDLREKFIPDADVVVATMWSTAPPVARLSRSKGKKYYLIQHYETWAGPEDQVNATWLLPLRKIVISKWLEEVGRQLGAHDMRHIPNGIDLKRFRISNPPEHRTQRMLSLYHESPFKGVPDALAVLKMYHEQCPQVPISMFGVPPRGSDIPDWITYLRNPAQAVLANEFYNRGTIYFSASVTEGWALPPAEAMACGCVFVGTDSGGVRDYAIHNETALLSPPRDRAAMLGNLLAVSQDRAMLQRLQRQGTQSIQQFTWERAGAALEQYFLE